MDLVTATADVSLPLIAAELAGALVVAIALHLVTRVPEPPRPAPSPGHEPAHEPASKPFAERAPDEDHWTEDATTDAGVTAPPVVAQRVREEQAQRSVFGMLRDALGRSRDVLKEGLDRLLGRPLDESATEDLEEVLLRADVGVMTTERLLTRVRASRADEDLRGMLRTEMTAILEPIHAPFAPAPGLWVVLVVGVNGSGKTTTIGKLAARLKEQGRKVLLAAGDTFRAAAEQQLSTWAERAGVDILVLDEGADPGAVAFKAIERARAEGHDVVLVDTAGRLQTRKPLMEELGKIRRVLDKALPGAPHETLLVLDGTMGQNGMSQAALFHEATPLTGVVVTKLDGTAKGGMILAIANELRLPVKLVGLGEKVGDLRDFDPHAFVDALL